MTASHASRYPEYVIGVAAEHRGYVGMSPHSSFEGVQVSCAQPYPTFPYSPSHIHIHRNTHTLTRIHTYTHTHQASMTEMTDSQHVLIFTADTVRSYITYMRCITFMVYHFDVHTQDCRFSARDNGAHRHASRQIDAHISTRSLSQRHTPSHTRTHTYTHANTNTHTHAHTYNRIYTCQTQVCSYTETSARGTP